MLRTENGSWGTEQATLHFQYIRHDTDEERPVLIFLHDALGSVSQWRSFPLLIAQRTGLDALIYERRGHGRSVGLNGQRHRRYLHDQALRTLPHLLRSLDIPHPILIGHSDGGTIALLYAGEHDTKMIIVIGAHILAETITFESIRQAVMEKKHIIDRLKKYHGEKTDDLFNAWAETWLHPDFQDWSIVEELRKIQCPVLAIQGTVDEYASEAQFIALTQSLGKKANTFWVENAGHFPHLTHTELMIRLISNFIQSRI